MKTKFTLILLFLSMCFSTCSLAQMVDFEKGNQWEFKKNTRGIKIYTRDAPSSSSGLKELKFTMEIETTLKNIAAVLLDVANYQNWVYKCTVSKKIEKAENLNSYDYYVADFPWPISDRDLYSYTTMIQNPITKVVQAQTVSRPTLRPKIEDLVRVINHKNQWIIRPLNSNKVEVTYYLSSDPAGNIPVWLVNLVIDQGPVKSMKKFVKLLDLDKYKNAEVKAIENY